MKNQETREDMVCFVDSHFHADILQHVSPGDFSFYAQKGGGISWSYVHEPKSWEAYPPYFDFLKKLSKTTAENEFPLFYLVGAHPRSFPPGSDSLTGCSFFWEALERHTHTASCLGLGELGLETGNAREIAIFQEHLDWAVAVLPKSKKIGIHTPRKNKALMTEKILEMIEVRPSLHARVVIDHVDSENLDMVQDSGLMMGMTMQEGKMSIRLLKDILTKYPELEDRIMLNSDSALKLSPEYQQCVSEVMPGISDSSHQKLVRGNACAFWGIAF